MEGRERESEREGEKGQGERKRQRGERIIDEHFVPIAILVLQQG